MRQIRCHGRQAVVVMARSQQEFVDLIAHHHHPRMAAQHRGDGFQLGLAQHHAGGIAGAVEHQQPALGGDRRFEGSRIESESAGGIAGDELHGSPG